MSVFPVPRDTGAKALALSNKSETRLNIRDMTSHQDTDYNPIRLLPSEEDLGYPTRDSNSDWREHDCTSSLLQFSSLELIW